MLLSEKRKYLIFITILLSTTIASMLSTALTTALTPIAKDLGVGLETGQWLTSGFSLAMGIMMPLTAYLIRRFPTRRLYLIGILVFMLGLVVSFFANNFTVMMSGRILQALGTGLLLAMSQVVILTIFPAEKRGMVMGWYGLASGAAPVLAPTFAGLLIDYFSWRAIFAFVFGIMILLLILAISCFDDVLEVKQSPFDIWSFILSGLAFGGVTLGIGNLGDSSLFSTIVFVPLVIGLVSGIIFSVRQLSLETPFLNLRILSQKQFLLSVLGSMLLYLVMMGSSVMLPLYVQSIRGLSATISGLVTLPGSLAMTIVSPLAGKIYDKLGMKRLFISGALFMFVSTGAMFFISLKTPIWIPALINVLRSLSIGCLMMPLITWGTSFVDETFVADATALLTSLRTIAGAIGSAIFVGIMTAVATNSVAAYGVNANIHGMNVSFFAMSLFALILLVLALSCPKSEK